MDCCGGKSGAWAGGKYEAAQSLEGGISDILFSSDAILWWFRLADLVE
jgi:hypothetical protein